MAEQSNRASPAVFLPLTLVDDTGYSLTLHKPAQRLVPLYGAVTELVVMLGQEAKLAGRTDADEHVAQLAHIRHLPSVGTHLQPNSERLAAVQPDLIVQFIGGRQDSIEQVERLRRMGFPVVAFKVAGVSDIIRVSDWLGEALQCPEAALRYRKGTEERLATVASQFDAKAKKPRVFFEVRDAALLAAGRASLVDDIIRLAGGENAVLAAGRIARLNEEALLSLDPDVYVYQQGVMNPNPVPPEKRPYAKYLKAVREQAVLKVDEMLFSRPGPRTVEAVEQLAQFLRLRASAEDDVTVKERAGAE